MKPCVSTDLYGGRPRVPTASRSEEWNQPRCWSEPSRYMSAGQRRSGRVSSTAAWLQPESTQTSRMSVSFRNSAPPPVAEDGGHVLDDALVEEQPRARAAVERHDRHAPYALAREHPIRPVGDHVVETLRAPGRDPADEVPDGVERLVPEPVLVERDEPLLGRPEERRVLAAPAVGIFVRESYRAHKGAHSLEVL